MNFYYPLSFISCFLLSVLFTPIVIKAAMRWGLVDMPNARSVHTKPVARLGGIAIFLSTILVVIPIIYIPAAGVHDTEQFREVIIILIASIAIFALGLFDDIKHIPSRYKFIGEMVIATVIYFCGIRIDGLSVEGLFSYDMPFVVSFPLTLLWLVGATNAVNLIDGLDGLAAGIAAIASAVIAVLSLYLGNTVLAIIMFALFGSLIGFLFYNFNPAKIFMGDCGSLFIGFLVASASTLTASKSHAIVGFALPILALGIPIFDTFFSMLRRFLERRGVMSADRGHFHHRLLDMGLNQKMVVVVAYLFTIVIVGFGLFMMATESFSTILVFFCCLVIILIGFRAVGAIRLRQTIDGISTKAAMARQARLEIRGFEDVQLHFRNSRTMDEWWDSLQLAAGRFGFEYIELTAYEADGRLFKRRWQKKDIVGEKSLIKFECPVNDCYDSNYIKVEIGILHNGFDFETAGRRLTLLCRLLDDYGLKKVDFLRDL